MASFHSYHHSPPSNPTPMLLTTLNSKTAMALSMHFVSRSRVYPCGGLISGIEELWNILRSVDDMTLACSSLLSEYSRGSSQLFCIPNNRVWKPPKKFKTRSLIWCFSNHQQISPDTGTPWEQAQKKKTQSACLINWLSAAAPSRRCWARSHRASWMCSSLTDNTWDSRIVRRLWKVI